MVGLRLMSQDENSSENSSDLFGNFIFTTISDESVVMAPHFANIVRQSVDKFLEVFDTIYITNQGVLATKELHHGAAFINGWYVTHDCVSGGRPSCCEEY